MEDILSILITVGFVTVAILANRKSKPHARRESENSNLPEGWPTVESVPGMKRHTSHTNTSHDLQSKAFPQKMHPDSQEIILDFENSSTTTGRKFRKSGKENPRIEPNTAGSETEEKSPLTADFELSKAVVWSEILRPKFQDE